MSARLSALIVACFALVVVLAQFVFVGQTVFHTWQYALALAVLAYAIVSYAAPAIRGQTDAGGRMLGVALIGALIVIADGLASGLLGADTQRIVRAPGSIAPLPDIGAAAFFSNADPQSIERGEASVILRRRNRPDVVVSEGAHRFLGASLLTLEPGPAAYVDAADENGNHLTITQQTGKAFLSPVLLFPDRQSIAGEMHPVDGFELPGVKRSVKVVYFSADDVARLHFPGISGGPQGPAILYDVFDGDRSIGIAAAPSGKEITIGGVRLRTAIGRYPALVIASVPAPIALLFGLALFVVGVLSTSLVRLPKKVEVSVSRP